MRKYYKNNSSGTIYDVSENIPMPEWAIEITKQEYGNIRNQYILNNTDKIENIIKIRCKCCGYKTVINEWDICPICYWEKDPFQEKHCLVSGGANKHCLLISKINYEKFKACEKEILQYCRKPNFLERLDKFLNL